MLNQIHTLEETLKTLRARYHIIATELANLKNKPNNDAKNEATIARLTQDIAAFDNKTRTLFQEVATLQRDLKTEQTQAQKLAAENRALSAACDTLAQKNALAAARASELQTWLANIDNETAG